MHLDQTHNDLYRKLRDTVEGGDKFLADLERQNGVLCSPLSEALIRFQQTDPYTGNVDFKNIRVENLVADTQEQFVKYEASLGRLWKEWEAAEVEVDKVYRETTTELHGEQMGDPETTKVSETLSRLRAVIEKEIEEAEEAIDELSDTAVAAAKDIEKVSMSNSVVLTAFELTWV